MAESEETRYEMVAREVSQMKELLDSPAGQKVYQFAQGLLDRARAVYSPDNTAKADMLCKAQHAIGTELVGLFAQPVRDLETLREEAPLEMPKDAIEATFLPISGEIFLKPAE